MNLIKRKFNNLLIDFKTMIEYYTKKEFTDMQKQLTRQLKVANAKITKLEEKIKKLTRSEV